MVLLRLGMGWALVEMGGKELLDEFADLFTSYDVW